MREPEGLSSNLSLNREPCDLGQTSLAPSSVEELLRVKTSHPPRQIDDSDVAVTTASKTGLHLPT